MWVVSVEDAARRFAAAHVPRYVDGGLWLGPRRGRRTWVAVYAAEPETRGFIEDRPAVLEGPYTLFMRGPGPGAFLDIETATTPCTDPPQTPYEAAATAALGASGDLPARKRAWVRTTDQATGETFEGPAGWFRIRPVRTC